MATRFIRGSCTSALLVLLLLTSLVGPSGTGSAGALSAAAPVGTVENFTDPAIGHPKGIAVGPDGNIWFTNYMGDSVGRMTPDGVVTTYSDPAIANPVDITAGPDGNMWFTVSGASISAIGRVTMAGTITLFTDPAIDGPRGIAAGPDGNVWFAGTRSNSIGRITPGGVVTGFAAAGVNGPSELTTGPDGNIWFTNYYGNNIGRMATTGAVTFFNGNGFQVSGPYGIAVGPDENIWFTNLDNATIGRITVGGVIDTFGAAGVASPGSIAAGPDGSMWFTQYYGTIGRISRAGAITIFAGALNYPAGITGGTGDEYMWVANEFDNAIARVTALNVDPYGEYTPVTPARVLDTRTGLGQGGVPASLPAGEVRAVQIAGEGGIPATGASAVVMNVTVNVPSSWGWVRIWPSGSPEPDVSNLNFVAGQTVANQVTVPLGPDGKVNAVSANGTIELIFDVTGSYADTTGTPGARYHGLSPVRVLDTRIPRLPLGPGDTLEMRLTGVGGVPLNGVSAVALNVTVTQPTSWGWVTVFPGDTLRPLASSVNFYAGQTVANMVIVRVSDLGLVHFYNQFGTTQLIADVVGYYDDDRSSEGGRFTPVVPERTFDSRRDWGVPVPPDDGVVIGWQDGQGQPLDWLGAVVTNVTATEPTSFGWITAFPLDAGTIPWVSNLNFLPGQTVPNQVMVRVSQPGNLQVPPGAAAFYNPYGYTHVVIDLFGFFTNANAEPAPLASGGIAASPGQVTAPLSARTSHLAAS